MDYKIIIAFVAFFLFLTPLTLEAQQAVFLVRHAEQAPEGEEPPLTEAGHRRAKTLAAMLKDSGINAIYTNGRVRSLQTAEPIAKGLNVESKSMPESDIDGLIRRLRTQHVADRVLIVTGSMTIPHLLKALGHSGDVVVTRFEYDNLFVIIPKVDGGASVVRLRY
jgi:broad specificity phosphatase PhoE